MPRWSWSRPWIYGGDLHAERFSPPTKVVYKTVASGARTSKTSDTLRVKAGAVLCFRVLALLSPEPRITPQSLARLPGAQV